MNSFLRRHWLLLAVLLLSSFWLAAFPIWSQWITVAPLRIPVSLAIPGRVQAEIQVRVPETYSLHFLFERDGVPFEELRTSIGAMGLCNDGEACSKGVPVPIRWSITPEGGDKPVLGGDVESQDSSGWSQAHVYRSIAKVRVPPGRYLFKAEILRPIPELAKLQTTIAMELQPKSTSTWQLGLVWWGAIAQYIIALPLAVCTALALLWRAGLTLRSSGHLPVNR
jgi:hypothetical protein